jgi:hypothetical protein
METMVHCQACGEEEEPGPGLLRRETLRRRFLRPFRKPSVPPAGS